MIADEEDLFPATDQRGYHESGPYAKFNQFRSNVCNISHKREDR